MNLITEKLKTEIKPMFAPLCRDLSRFSGIKFRPGLNDRRSQQKNWLEKTIKPAFKLKLVLSFFFFSFSPFDLPPSAHFLF